MSKATISSNYIEQQKAAHPPVPRDLRHSVALVIGSDGIGNIGKAVAERLSHECLDVYEYDLKTQDIGQCVVGGVNVGAPGRVRDMIPNLPKGRSELVDTIVFCNGQSHLDWIEDQPAHIIHDVIHNSLTASIIGARDFVRATLSSPRRKYIVFIGSMAYRSVLNASAPYCAAKAGLAHFAKCLAWELAPKNYNVFCVHPSNTEGTPMTEETIAGLARYRGISREEAEAYWGAVLPKQQWLQPSDIGRCIAWLTSGEADYLSGTNVDMAGGQR